MGSPECVCYRGPGSCLPPSPVTPGPAIQIRFGWCICAYVRARLTAPWVCRCFPCSECVIPRCGSTLVSDGRRGYCRGVLWPCMHDAGLRICMADPAAYRRRQPPRLPQLCFSTGLHETGESGIHHVLCRRATPALPALRRSLEAQAPAASPSRIYTGRWWQFSAC